MKKRAPLYGCPWLDDGTMVDAFKSLVNWYTADEIAQLMGRTPGAIKRKMNLLGVRLLWRKNHSNGFARLWQKQELAELYAYAGVMTQPEMAKKLKVPLGAVINKWRLEDASWMQGRVNLSDIARLAGCTAQYVSKKAREVFGTLPATGTNKGRRYRLSEEQAERLMMRIRPGRVSYVSQLFCGK